MKVLSLFDGMSCAQLALQKAGIPVTRYYASEVDKYAIKVTQANFPDTVQLGDVRQVTADQVGDIDLLVGGSPCQGFSFAGKHLNFDDPRSKLFFEYVRLLKELKPKYFLLENVRMAQQSQDVISEHLGVEPIPINSNLVSAQNRYRLYWTNIPFNIPDDKDIVLADIIEDGMVDRNKSHCLDANYFKGGNLKSYFEKHRRQLVFKSGRIVNRRLDEKGVRKDYDLSIPNQSRLEVRTDDKTNCLTTVDKDSVVVAYRKLTPVECERLQTVPDNYTNHVSNSQRYKMLGNGMTVDIISSILGGIR
jgi:site-specific DNA-cytosine methylase